MYGSTTNAISTAYEAHAEELRRFASARVRETQAAEDVVQEAYLRLAIESRAGRFPHNPRAWLYRVTSNTIISRGRRATTAARIASTHPTRVTDDVSPESRYLSAEGTAELATAMLAASPRGRQGLVMAAEGYSGREIAVALGRSEVATRALLCRSRATVRQRLAVESLRSEEANAAVWATGSRS